MDSISLLKYGDYTLTTLPDGEELEIDKKIKIQKKGVPCWGCGKKIKKVAFVFLGADNYRRLEEDSKFLYCSKCQKIYLKSRTIVYITNKSEEVDEHLMVRRL